MVQLDWDIESENVKHEPRREDPNERGKRYRGLLRLLLIIVVLLGIVALAVWLISKRLEQVDARLEQLLTETVQAEVAALRIGDPQAFADLQRSATDDWIIAQRATFQQYQARKSSSSISLTGNVTDVEISGQRGRVQVEEIVDGISYTQTWFYWRYEDGWRHVPPDYTFWGASQNIEAERYTINYDALDLQTARSIDAQLSAWLAYSCSVINCEALPTITVNVVAEPSREIRWMDDASGAWVLHVPSPFALQARTDLPFDSQMRVRAATLLADRMVDLALGTRTPAPNTDAEFLRESVRNWFVRRFVQVQADEGLVGSMAAQYGDEAVTRLLQTLSPTAQVSILSTVAGVSDLSVLDVDWADFIVWRLLLEDRLIQMGDESAWLQFYDPRDPAIVQQAYTRYNTPITGELAAIERTVLSWSRSTAPDGTPQLVADVQIQNGTSVSGINVVFNLVNNTWLRAN